MTTEIMMLACAVVLGFIYLVAAATASTKQRGLKWNMSSRNGETPPLTGAAGRLDRAFQNFKETFPFFVAAVVVVTATGTRGQWSEIGSYLYVIARALYLPIYAFDITVIRTLVWAASAAGIVLVLVQAFA